MRPWQTGEVQGEELCEGLHMEVEVEVDTVDVISPLPSALGTGGALWK